MPRPAETPPGDARTGGGRPLIMVEITTLPVLHHDAYNLNAGPPFLLRVRTHSRISAL
jgi:hypothetical protein